MRQVRVLIADDDEDQADALTMRCRALGLQVDSAGNALIALQKIEENEPDLVVLDVNMPCGNGLSVCETMANHPRLRSIPVIIFTGDKDREIQRRCHSMCAYYVPKCPDVWSRIDPLLRQLLHLAPRASDAPTAESPLGERSPAETQPGAAARPSRYRRKDAVPLADRQSENDSALPGAMPPCATEGRPWVLCIDDDSEFSWALKLRLARHGVDLLPTYAGMQGYRCAFENRARAILLDYEMPDGDGSYILRRLKENPLTQTIPVIVVSGHHNRALERQMFNLGAVGFMTKPIDWDRLWAKLRPYVETRRSPNVDVADVGSPLDLTWRQKGAIGPSTDRRSRAR